MDASGLASRSLLLSWDRPRYELLDQRGALLALLDEAHGVEGFLPSQASVDVRMEGGVALNLSTVGAWAYELTGQDLAPPTSAIELLQRVGGFLEVRHCRLRASFQHLMEWPDWTSATQASREGVRRFLGEPGWFDFALLIDGSASDGWTYQAEFGVLGADDVPARLTRHVGQIGRNAGPQPRLDEEILAGAYPAVATFIDSSWKGPPLDFELGSVDEEVARLEVEARHLAERCHQRLHVVSTEPATKLDTTEGME